MKRLILLSLLVLVLFVGTVLPAFADGVFFSGTLTDTLPSMTDRPDDCGFLSGTAGIYYYTTHTVQLTDSPFMGYFDFYNALDIVVTVYPEGGFDPLDPLANCVAVLDNDETGITLAPGSYTFVVTSYDEGAVGTYEFAFGYPGIGESAFSEALLLPNGRPNSDGIGCTSTINEGAGYLYVAEAIVLDISGLYSYYDLYDYSGGMDVWFSLYEGAFDSANPLANCIANFDDEGQIYLQAGVVYTLMVATYDSADVPCDCEGNYFVFLFMTLGGGSATAGVDVCLYPLPTDALVYQIPAGAPVFYQPDLATQLQWNLPVGTWYITDFSGDFAHVWIACNAQQIWVPKNAVLIP